MANQIITGGGKNEITLDNDGANYELNNGENILKGLRLYLKNNYTNKNETFYNEVVNAVSCSSIIDIAISNFKKRYVDPKIEAVKQEIISETKPTISFDIGFIRHEEERKQEAYDYTDSCGDTYTKYGEPYTVYYAVYGIKNVSITGDHSILKAPDNEWRTSSVKKWNNWISIYIPATEAISIIIDNKQIVFPIGTDFSMAGNRGNMNTGWYKHYSVQIHL